MINIKNRRLDQSTLKRMSVNCSIATQGRDIEQLEQSFYHISQEQKQKQHTLPTLQEKKGLFEQIYAAVYEKQNGEMRNSIFRDTQYKLLIKNSNKTLKLKTNKRKKVQRQQSVMERDINKNCMIRGLWIPQEQTWFPQFREFGAMQNFAGSIYMSGGFGNSVNNDFCKYNLSTNVEYLASNKWDALQPITPRYGHTMTSTSQGLFIIGGEQINDYGPMKSKCFVNEIQRYDGSKWSIIKYSGIFQMRKYHSATTYRDSIFIVGGEGFKNKALSDTILFDTCSNRFISLNSQPSVFSRGIKHTAIVEVQETIYLYGGINQDDQVYDQLYTYDQVQQWKPKETIGSRPPKLTMHTMVYYDPFILLYGGKVDDQLTTYQNQIYALRMNEWFIVEQEGSIPEARAGHSSCIANNQLLICGGFNLDGYLSCQMQSMEIKRVYQVNRVLSLPALKSEPTENLIQEKRIVIKTRLSLRK